MCRELALIEKLGVEFEERDGLFYPLVYSDGFGVFCNDEDVKTKNLGGRNCCARGGECVSLSSEKKR